MHNLQQYVLPVMAKHFTCATAPETQTKMTEDLLLLQVRIKENAKYIEALIQKMDKNKNTTLVDILREEIIKLRTLNTEYREMIETKKVVHTDKMRHKTRYYLKDGSTYVVDKRKNIRYLYDAKSKTITYEFPNGQVEKTFEGGIKEVRHPDGSITVRHGEKDYDFYH